MDDLKWDEKGLMPAVVQDAGSKDVLMVAYMNKEALDLTLKTKTALLFKVAAEALAQGRDLGPHPGREGGPHRL